jgi:hypothetical protein
VLNRIAPGDLNVVAQLWTFVRVEDEGFEPITMVQRSLEVPQICTPGKSRLTFMADHCAVQNCRLPWHVSICTESPITASVSNTFLSCISGDRYTTAITFLEGIYRLPLRA